VHCSGTTHCYETEIENAETIQEAVLSHMLWIPGTGPDCPDKDSAWKGDCNLSPLSRSETLSGGETA